MGGVLRLCIGCQDSDSVWKVFGWYPEGVQKVSRRYLEWKVFGGYLKGKLKRIFPLLTFQEVPVQKMCTKLSNIVKRSLQNCQFIIPILIIHSASADASPDKSAAN